jgi:conjugative relaxase-like TrwC/TraI family protein
MLVLSSASSGGISYWQRSAAHETWLGQGAPLLGLGGPVEPSALGDLLRGKAPGNGPLTARPAQRRRRGWDLVFAAPKSVSLLATGAGREVGAAVRAAHRQAVADAFGLMERCAAWVSAGRRREPAKATVAAAFEHLSSDAGQPHLHTHVVLPNLALRPDGRWGCLAGTELWRWREGLGAAYGLALRANLGEAGLALDWERHKGGLWEVRGTAHVLAAQSSRSLAAKAAATWFGSTSARAHKVAQGGSRAKAVGSSNLPDLAGLVELARSDPRVAVPPAPPSPHAVERALAERRSSFSPPDVLVALSETSERGLRAADALHFTSRFSPTGLASHFDEEVINAAVEGRSAHVGKVTPTLAYQEIAALGFSGAIAEAAAQVACSGFALEVLPRAPWLAQAACLDAARAAWQAAGVTVTLACPNENSERRWRALTSLRPADGTIGQPGNTVLVVDAADHLGPAKLARLSAQAARAGTKLVLVPGGTAPLLRESMASSLDQLIASCPTSLVGAEPSTSATNPEVSVPGLAVRGALAGHDAIAHTVSAWLAAAARGEPAIMVGLGKQEVEALNLAARARLGLAGNSAEVDFGSCRLAPGDRVTALCRIGPVRAATLGTVSSTNNGVVMVKWHGWPSSLVVHADCARHLGYGYATTVPYLRNCSPATSLLVLGDPYSAPGLRPSSTWVTVAGPGMPGPHPNLRRRAAICELATSWPDEQILAHAGPRPLKRAERARWAELASAQALERTLGARQVLAPQRGRGPALSL